MCRNYFRFCVFDNSNNCSRLGKMKNDNFWRFSKNNCFKHNFPKNLVRFHQQVMFFEWTIQKCQFFGSPRMIFWLFSTTLRKLPKDFRGIVKTTFSNPIFRKYWFGTINNWCFSNQLYQISTFQNLTIRIFDRFLPLFENYLKTF